MIKVTDELFVVNIFLTNVPPFSAYELSLYKLLLILIYYIHL